MYRKTLILSLLVCLFVSGSWAMGKAPKQPAKKSAEVIDFTLKDLAGRGHTLSDYRGKVIFLNFWASWCPPCRAEMPSMQKLYEKSDKDKFVMLAVNLRESRQKVKNFADKNGYTFPILLDTTGKVGSQYRVYSIPTTYIIDQQGKLISKVTGARDWSWDEFKPLIK